jgi:UrcA family protein
MTPIKYAAMAIFAAAALPAGMAAAQDVDTVVDGQRSGDNAKAYVKFRDLNLGSTEGVAALKSRVRRAANSVCMPNGVTDLATTSRALACRGTAIAAAQPQIARAVERFRNQDYAALAPISMNGLP